MSLVLVWESPFDTWNPVVGRVRVTRQTPLNPGVASYTPIVICEDAGWNCHVDTEENDEASEYLVEYCNRVGVMQFAVLDENIQRFKLHDGIAMATIETRSLIGTPEPGRRIEVSDETSAAGTRVHHFLTNREGKATFPLRQGARVLIRIEGQMLALDTIVPRKPVLTYPDLRCAGSLVDTDRRGWY